MGSFYTTPPLPLPSILLLPFLFLLYYSSPSFSSLLRPFFHYLLLFCRGGFRKAQLSFLQFSPSSILPLPSSLLQGRVEEGSVILPSVLSFVHSSITFFSFAGEG